MSIERTSIFATSKIPATDIFQNHLDEVHNLLEQFCKENSSYDWELSTGDKKIRGFCNIENFLEKNTPSLLVYRIKNKEQKRLLTLEINNGLTLYIKNGSHCLYGLYKQIEDITPSINAPSGLVFLRRYWLFNLLAAILLMPSFTILIFSGGWIFLWWLIPVIICEVVFLFLYFNQEYTGSDGKTYVKDVEWDKIILSVHIRYGKYNSKLGTPVYSVFNSSKAIVSVLASLATVISFIILVVTR